MRRHGCFKGFSASQLSLGGLLLCAGMGVLRDCMFEELNMCAYARVFTLYLLQEFSFCAQALGF